MPVNRYEADRMNSENTKVLQAVRKTDQQFSRRWGDRIQTERLTRLLPPVVAKRAYIYLNDLNDLFLAPQNLHNTQEPPQQTPSVPLTETFGDRLWQKVQKSRFARLFPAGLAVGGAVAGGAACAPGPEATPPPAIVTPAAEKPTLVIPPIETTAPVSTTTPVEQPTPRPLETPTIGVAKSMPVDKLQGVSLVSYTPDRKVPQQVEVIPQIVGEYKGPDGKTLAFSLNNAPTFLLGRDKEKLPFMGASDGNSFWIYGPSKDGTYRVLPRLVPPNELYPDTVPLLIALPDNPDVPAGIALGWVDRSGKFVIGENKVVAVGPGQTFAFNEKDGFYYLLNANRTGTKFEGIRLSLLPTPTPEPPKPPTATPEPPKPTATKPPEATATPEVLKGEKIDSKLTLVAKEKDANGKEVPNGIEVRIITAKDVPVPPIVWNKARNPNAEADIVSWWKDLVKTFPVPKDRNGKEVPDKFEVFMRLPDHASGEPVLIDRNKPVEFVFGVADKNPELPYLIKWTNQGTYVLSINADGGLRVSDLKYIETWNMVVPQYYGYTASALEVMAAILTYPQLQQTLTYKPGDSTPSSIPDARIMTWGGGQDKINGILTVGNP